MCGIVGYISNNDNIFREPKDHFMRYALMLDTLRGDDSTGLVTLSKRFTVKTLKTTMAGDVFVHSPEYVKKYKTGWGQIGHNRAATRGKVHVDNAHPFTFGPITLVHNGTLHDGGKGLDAFDKTIGEVDSMQIAFALSKCSPKNAKRVIEQLDGAYALVWTDTRDESINMCRNKDRPLHFTFNTAKNVMWFMSDGHHLHSINKSFGQHECKGGSVFEMDVNKILKYTKGKTTPEVVRFSPFVYQSSQGQWRNGQWTSPDKKPTESPTDHTKKTDTSKATSTGGQSKKRPSALEKATGVWIKNAQTEAKKRELEGSGGTTKPTTGTVPFSNEKVMVQGRMRKVPLSMQRALFEEMQITPDDLLQFQPDDAEQLPNGNYVVYGSMLHQDWTDCPWEMTLHNVSRIQYMAYKNDDWLVRPIGLCPAHTFDQTNAAVLGHLVHCDWTGYRDTCYPNQDDDSSDDDQEGDPIMDSRLLVPGPGGYMIEWGRLNKLMDSGCIYCGADLMEADMTGCTIVNNGQDLQCAGCVLELDGTETKNPTLN